MCLLEAQDKVDSGPIYYRTTFTLDGDELIDRIHQETGRATIELCQQFVQEYPRICSQGREQNGVGSTYPRRGPQNSELDPQKSIAEQFDLLRTVDNEAYPAFFKLRGKKYTVKIEAD